MSDRVVKAEPKPITNAALQAAIAAELADIDGGTPSTTFTEEIDGGTP